MTKLIGRYKKISTENTKLTTIQNVNPGEYRI